MQKNQDHSRKYIKEQKGKYPAFQVQIECLDEPYSEYFPFSRYGSREEALLAAKKARDEIVEAFKKEMAAKVHRTFVATSFSSANNTGIIGISRSYSNKYKTWSWQTAWVSLEGKPVNRNRSTKEHGEKGALLQVIDLRYEALLKVAEQIDDEVAVNKILEFLSKYDAIKSYLLKISPSEEGLLFEYLTRQDIPGTEKEELINGRIGQETFRRKVLTFWGEKCCITGATDLLVAAHIKPWRDSNDIERIDVYNGLSLSPVYDKAFDYGLITFDEIGKIIISKAFEENAKLLEINENAQLQDLTPFHERYFSFHRKNHYCPVNS